MDNHDIKVLFGKRLKQARKMAGLSLRNLSKQIKGIVSHNALSKYEKGEMMPGSEVLIALSNVLNQGYDFFFRPMKVKMNNIRFRKKVRMSKRVENSIIEKATDFFERYCEIEEIVGDVQSFNNPLKEFEVSNVESAEEAAKILREKWNLGNDPIPNVHELLELKGIKVYQIDENDEYFDGLCATTDVGPVVVVSKRLEKNLPRKRMTTIHEMAHAVMNVPDNIDKKMEEQITNRFAGAFLMPKDTFIAVFGKHRTSMLLGELIEIKSYFGTSIWSIVYRAKQLGQINESSFLNFCRSASSWRTNKKEPGDDNYKGDEHHSRFMQLVYRAFAQDIISESKATELLKVSITIFRNGFRERY